MTGASEGAEPASAASARSRPRLSVVGLFSAAGFVALAATVLGFFGGRHWALEILAHFRVQYFLGLTAIAALMGRAGRRRLARAYVVGAAVNLWMLIPYFWPAPFAEAPGGEEPVRCLYINLYGDNQTPEKVVALLEETEADIVILAELGLDWPERLEPLRGRFPFRLLEPRYDNFGMGVLCRREPESARLLRHALEGENEEIPAAEIVWRAGARRGAFLGVHPPPPVGARYARWRDAHYRQMAEWARTRTEPCLIIGDLNSSPYSPRFRDLLHEGGLRDSIRGRGWQVTWPVGLGFWPMAVPLDHALYRGAWTPVARRTLPGVGSDHLPILIAMAWSDDPVLDGP